MKVYLYTRGSYSDYCVISVHSTEEGAKAAAERDAIGERDQPSAEKLHWVGYELRGTRIYNDGTKVKDTWMDRAVEEYELLE